ncbi:hypothetical protein [Mycobacterium sp.]|uniref:hypothetical protein n=1 Tax=Mycobacterium sp. TaxID=1785 RepID=UPI0025D8D186|nr:hypothetical protein [Mycobacterium sp.]
MSNDNENKFRFIDGLLQNHADEPGLPGQTVTDLIFVNGLLERVDSRAMGV